MTRKAQKESERRIVLEADKLLKANWIIGEDEDREHPDFVITENSTEFGLEVTELFKGQTNSRGSVLKKHESDSQKKINLIRGKYERATNIPLIVKFLGDVGGVNIEQIVSTLKKERFSEYQPGQSKKLHVQNGNDKLDIYVTHGIERSDWFSINDRVGWVNTSPQPSIEEKITNKAKKLKKYKKNSGTNDIRLLIFANRIMNSGKILFPEETGIDLQGFSKVYLFSYPYEITVLE